MDDLMRFGSSKFSVELLNSLFILEMIIEIQFFWYTPYSIHIFLLVVEVDQREYGEDCDGGSLMCN